MLINMIYNIKDELHVEHEINMIGVELEGRKDYNKFKKDIFGNSSINLWFIDHHLDKVIGNKKLFFLKYKSEVIGIVGLRFRKADTFGFNFGLLEKSRGKGLSLDCLNVCLNYIKEQGYTILRAKVREDNIAAVTLYNKVGFEREKRG